MTFPPPPTPPSKSLQEIMFDPKPQFSNTITHKNFRELTQKSESSYRNSCSQEILQFRLNHQEEEAMEGDNSGENSPPLWKNSPSPPKSPSHPLLSHHNHRSLSPNSRAQAIARGQSELMEMVKNMPESSYELSLKDLVEHHRIESQSPRRSVSNNQRGAVRVKRQESKKNEKNVMRSASFENKGLFLNMVFPFSLKSKKKNKIGSNTNGKVSPKPEGLKGERDFWKKRFTGSSDSDSSRLSNNSSSTEKSSSGGSSSSGRSHGGGRRRNGFSAGCCFFFKSRKSKSVD